MKVAAAMASNGSYCVCAIPDLHELAKVAESEELQRLVRLMVRRIEWRPDGEHRIQYYLPRPAPNREWFATSVQSDTADLRSCEPLIQVCRGVTGSILSHAVVFFRSTAAARVYNSAISIP